MSKRVLATLPDKKYYEYAYHKYFTTDALTFEEWTPLDTWTYPPRDIIRFEQIITNQLQHIRNKKVLDLATHLGYISLFCLHNKAEHVIGTNVREKELKIADEICHLAGYSNYEFCFSDMNDMIELKKLCDKVDTVIFAGTIYHTNLHMSILKTIYESNAKTLIVESDYHQKDPEIPSLIYRKENSDAPEHGWEGEKKTVFVGTPNRSWLQHAMENIGFKITYDEQVMYANSIGNLRVMGTMVGQKD